MTPFAGADDITFNGGDVLTCTDSKPVIADVFEAELENKFDLDLGGPRLALFSKVEMAIKRLEKFSPIRAKNYRDQALGFFAEMQLLGADQIVPAQDVYDVEIPSDCELTQVADEMNAQIRTGKRYFIRKGLWSSLDDDNKAALILHEVIFREAISFGQTNSKASRYLNSLLFSHALDTTTQDQFDKIMAELDFHNLSSSPSQF